MHLSHSLELSTRHLAGVCALEIRRTVPSTTSPANLHVAEVELYDYRNNRIPSAALAFSLSSTWDSSYVVSNCFDGNISTICSTGNSVNNTLDPRMRITYSCPDGTTPLARVVVKNRIDCCQEGINAFSLNYLGSLGTADRPPYVFSGSQASYDITVTSKSVASMLFHAALHRSITS
jgi:hypothetical protein